MSRKQLRYLQVGHSALAAPEEGTLAPDGEVDLGELEAVLVLVERLEPLARVLGLRLADEKAFGGWRPRQTRPRS